jgi:Ca-activated chloride channel homolog
VNALLELDNPRALWLLLLAPALAAVLVARFRADRAGVRSLAGSARFAAHYNTWLVKSFFSGILSVAFVILAVFALAGPRGARRLVPDERMNLDAVFLLDASRSMLATDVAPSRLAVATDAAARLAAALPGPRVAVVAFKGEGYRMLPLTEDPEALSLVLSVVGPDVSTSTGSDLEAGIRAALASLADAGRYRVIFLLSDGERLTGDAVAAARAARAAGVPIVPIAVGTAEGAPLVLPDGATVFGASGRPVITRMDLAQLQDIATAGGGRVYRPEDTARIARELMPLLKGLGDREWSQGVRAVRRPLHGLFIALALITILAARLVRALRVRGSAA